MRSKSKKPDTLLTHAGRSPEDNFGVVNPPVYHASTIIHRTVADLEKAQQNRYTQVTYGRWGTPTTFAFEEAVARGIGAVCLSMGTTTEPALLEQVWADVPHRQLESPEDLSRHVQPLFREALRRAAASRRNVRAPARSGR